MHTPTPEECSRLLPRIDIGLLSVPAQQWYNSSSKLCALIWETDNGFQNRPPQDLWQQRLAKAFDDARDDPCGADILATMGWECGTTCRLNAFANEVWLAVYGGWSLAVCDNKFSSSVFFAHFNHNVPTCRSVMCSSLNSASHVFDGRWQLPGSPWSNAGVVQSGLTAIDTAYLGNLNSFIYTNMFEFNAPTRAGMETQKQIAGLSSVEKYIGVHIRHGDKSLEGIPDTPVEKYADKVKGFISHDLNVVFLATDDKFMKSQLESLLGSSVRVLEVHRRDDTMYTWQGTEADEQSIFTFLTEIDILKQADIFIGTGSSNVGRFINHLRRPSNSSISLEGTWPAYG